MSKPVLLYLSALQPLGLKHSILSAFPYPSFILALPPPKERPLR